MSSWSQKWRSTSFKHTKLSALPQESSSSWGCGRPHHSQLSSMLLWEQDRAGSTEKRAGALGGRRGTAAWRRAITFLGRRPPARKICVNVMNFAGMLRRVKQRHPGPENNLAPRAAGWCPAPTCLRKSTAVSQGCLGRVHTLPPWLCLQGTRLCRACLCQPYAGRRKVQSPQGGKNPALQLAV